MRTDDLGDFLPYLLNQAAEAVSRDFQADYKDRYGMLRTEWRVLFHLGQRGAMTAKEICDQASLHKTKVSRAVTALEQKRFLSRAPLADDRRSERLTLTEAGQTTFSDLSQRAVAYDAALSQVIGEDDMAHLKSLLKTLLDR